MKTSYLPQPNFKAVRGAEQLLAHPAVQIEDLVAVFTNGDAPGGMLLYNTQDAPELPSELQERGWSTNIVAGIEPQVYSRFDGPVITMAAIDALLDDIPSHGTYFYPMQDLDFFWQEEQRRLFVRTACKLVSTIWAHRRQLPQNEQQALWPLHGKRMVQLCLPAALLANEDADLVALRFDFSRLDGRDILQSLATRKGFATPVFNRPGHPNDIQCLAHLGDQEWLAGFKEIPLLVPHLERHASRLLLFRPVLRKFASSQRVRSTCLGLARRCWHAWGTGGNPMLQEAAYALAAEAWLEGKDATDLVAILPDQDFLQFVLSGKARAVSRGPVAQTAASENQVSVEDILQNPDLVPPGPVLAVPVLGRVLRRRGATEVFDLGPLLWQAEKYMALARTFWLLSRDLLENPSPDWLQIEASLDEISDLAQRAALIYGLGNPWAWRQGRYSLLVSECYAHLDRCLDRQAAATQNTSHAFYFSTLRSWYGCALQEDVKANLARVVESGRTFAVMCEGKEISDDLAHELRTVNHLVDAADRLLPHEERAPLTEQKFASVSEMLRNVTKYHEPVVLPSLMFGYWSQILLAVDYEWQQIQVATAERRPDAAKLDHLQESLDKWQRRAFAPYHELQVLMAGLRTKSEQVRRLRHAGGEQPEIRVVVRTAEVDLGSKQTIALEIQNNGDQAANSFVWNLKRYSGFELISSLPAPQPSDLAPGDRRSVDIQVRATEPTLMLEFGYRYRDRSGRLQTGEDRTYLQARRDTISVHTRINPFEVGRPVVGASFFDRTTEINQILTRLAKGNTHPVVLRGPRRIGKSSLLRKIAELLDQPAAAKKEGYLSAELQPALHNLHPVVASLQKMDRALARPFEGFMLRLLDDIGRRLAVDVEPLLLTFARTAGLSGVPIAFMEQVSALLAQRPNEHVVILVDELDEVFREDSRELAIHLRTIIESETRISWIAASTMLVEASIGRYGSPWFNLLEPIQLREMDWRSAFRMVRNLGGRAGFDWSEEAVRAILELSGRRPYLVQLLGVRTTDELNLQGRDRVESSDVTAAVNQLVGEITLTGSYLGFVWNEARWLGKLILWHLLTSVQPLRKLDLQQRIWQQLDETEMAPYQERFYAAFDERMAWLIDIADTLEIDGSYHVTFAVPLIKRFLERILQREQDFVRRATLSLALELKG